jgi:DtxR family Mn-dependent transcriptional regulator
MWECFLADQLQLPWELVHDYACRLEHATDTAVTEALYEYLGRPRRCPHGNPIPDVAGETHLTNDRPLAEMTPGQQGVISRVSPESTLLLEYLAGRNLRPGQALRFEEIAPFNGPLMVICCGERHALGQEIAAHIFVKLDD